MDSQHIQLQKLAAEVEAKEWQIREEADNRVRVHYAVLHVCLMFFSSIKLSSILLQIHELTVFHQKELQNLRVDYAMHNSAAQMAELQSKVETQEVG